MNECVEVVGLLKEINFSLLLVGLTLAGMLMIIGAALDKVLNK